MKVSDARQIAYCLCETSLRGVDSHGIKLLPHYLKSAEYGRKNPKPKFEIKKKYPCLIKLNADDAFGHIAGLKAISIGTKISNKYGIIIYTSLYYSRRFKTRKYNGDYE